MSMTSKVKQEVYKSIVAFLQSGTTATNTGIKAHVLSTLSLRAVQEATQKLLREGVLETYTRKSQKVYKLAPETKSTAAAA